MGRGRKKLPANEKRNEHIIIRTTRREKFIIKKLAKKHEMKMSEYIMSRIKENNENIFINQ